MDYSRRDLGGSRRAAERVRRYRTTGTGCYTLYPKLANASSYQASWGEVLSGVVGPGSDGARVGVWRLRHHLQASIPAPAMRALRTLVPLKVSRRARRPRFLSPNIVALLYDGDVDSHQFLDKASRPESRPGARVIPSSRLRAPR